MESEETPSFASPRDKLILFVDDDESVRDLLQLTIGLAGFQLILAVDGLDAAAKIEQKMPDLIVADLMMPGQSGFEFMRTLSGTGAGSLPVFVVTGRVLDASTIAMIKQEANVVEFFTKPIKMPRFISALHRQLKTAPLAK